MAADPEVVKVTSSFAWMIGIAIIPLLLIKGFFEILFDSKSRRKRSNYSRNTYISGRQSGFLFTSEIMNAGKGLLWILGGLFTCLIIAFSVKPSTTTGLLLFLFATAFIIKFTSGKSKQYNKVADKYYHGRKGENTVSDELNLLSDTYCAFRNIKFENRGDIDFVVLGPTGLFTIEVKSHWGEIGFDGQELTNNGIRFERDFLKQAKGEALQINNYLKTQLHKDIYIQPIIVFANHVKIRFGKKQIYGVHVIGRPWLNELISNGQQRFTPEEVSEISVELEKLVAK